MKWLNVSTELRDNPVFAQATDAQRGIWIALMIYCAGCENGGRIIGAKSWNTRTWLQAVGVERDDVLAECPLWHWSDPAGIDSLIVHEYPIEQERRFKANRQNGSHGGAVRTRAKKMAARSNGALGGRPKRVNGHNPSENPSENPT